MNRPSSTTAATTAFCAVKIEGPGGFLWVDGNGKITANNGTLDNPRPNAFSLVQIETCPGATPTCKQSCYVHNLERHASQIHDFYRHNTAIIVGILNDNLERGYRGRAAIWAEILGKWIAENCSGGFRWHVSGDVFSARYAQWIALVCSYSPDITHWIYTRSFYHEFLHPLTTTPNLTVNLSCDVNNYLAAKHAMQEYGGRLCYLTLDGKVPDDLPVGSVIFPDYNLRGGTDDGQKWFSSLAPEYRSFVCPVDFHGKAENRRCGPCDRCIKKP